MSLPDQKFRWLTSEQGFQWNERVGAFVNPELPGEQVTPAELRARISFRCFQRAVQLKVERARKRLISKTA